MKVGNTLYVKNRREWRTWLAASRWAQRFSPRRSTSRLSDMTRERVRRLIKAKRMTKRQASPGGLRAAAALLPEDDRAEQAVRDGAVTAA
jgi:hypothetical protein